MLISRLAAVPVGLVVWFVCLTPLPTASDPLLDRLPPLNRVPLDGTTQDLITQLDRPIDGTTPDLITQLDRPIDNVARHHHVDPAATRVAAVGTGPVYGYPSRNVPAGLQSGRYEVDGARSRALPNTLERGNEARIPFRRAREGTLNAAAAVVAAAKRARSVRAPYGLEPAFGVPTSATREARSRDPFAASRMADTRPLTNTLQHGHHARMPPGRVQGGTSNVAESTQPARTPSVLKPASIVPDSSTRPAFVHHPFQTPAKAMPPHPADPNQVSKAADALLASLNNDRKSYPQLRPVQTVRKKPNAERNRPSHPPRNFFASERTARLMREYLQAKVVEMRRGMGVVRDEREVELVAMAEEGISGNLLNSRLHNKLHQAQDDEWKRFTVGGFFVALTRTNKMGDREGYTVYSVVARPVRNDLNMKSLSVGVYAVPDLSA